MNLELNKIVEQLEKNDFISNFMKELAIAIENFNNKGEKEMKNIELTPEKELEFERKEFEFLQKYFEKELSDLSKGELFMVTNKYNNDAELNRYKVTQYKDNLECKYIALGKDLPDSIKIGDLVRKANGKYIYDEEATKYVTKNIENIKNSLL